MNDLPDYLISGASNQLILHRTNSPSVSSTSQYDDHSAYLPAERDQTVRKRHYHEEEFIHPNKQHVVTERVIPVNHQRATVVHEEKPMVRTSELTLIDYFFDFSFHKNHHLNA